jgi:hypothetical protein
MKIHNLLRLCVTGVTCLGVLIPSLLLGAQRPNVIVIISDDQGWADIGYNNPREKQNIARQHPKLVSEMHQRFLVHRSKDAKRSISMDDI